MRISTTVGFFARITEKKSRRKDTEENPPQENFLDEGEGLFGLRVSLRGVHIYRRHEERENPRRVSSIHQTSNREAGKRIFMSPETVVSRIKTEKKEKKVMRKKQTLWKCEVCGQRYRAGDPEQYGDFHVFRCPKHPGGKGIGLVMADYRRRKRDEESIRKRGVTTGTYIRGLMMDSGRGNPADGKKETDKDRGK
jgi:hypothetical protein